MSADTDFTVAEVVELYLADLMMRVEGGSFKRDSFEQATISLKAFVAAFGAQRVSECRQHNLTRWIAAHPGWKSVHTKKRNVTNVLACFNWAAEEQLVRFAPYRSPRVLRGIGGRARRQMTRGEYVLLMGGRSSRAMRRALFFMRRTGVRTVEMRILKWENCFLDGPFPYIAFPDHKTRRHTGQDRKIGLDAGTVRFLRNLRRQALEGPNEPAPSIDEPLRTCTRCGKEKILRAFATGTANNRPYVRAWCKACMKDYHHARDEARRAGVRHQRERLEAQEPDTEHVFLNCDRQQWGRRIFCQHFRRQAKRIGMDEGAVERCCSYGLRHLYAVDAIEAGITTRMIADQLGHTSTAMIDRIYGSHSKHKIEHLSNVANEIANKRKRSSNAGDNPKEQNP
jgi:integrase